MSATDKKKNTKQVQGEKSSIKAGKQKQETAKPVSSSKNKGKEQDESIKNSK